MRGGEEDSFTEARTLEEGTRQILLVSDVLSEVCCAEDQRRCVNWFAKWAVSDVVLHE